MEGNKIIAAIDLSSSKCLGIIAEKRSDNSIKILAQTEIKTKNAIKKGVIYNYDETTKIITSIKEELEHQAKVKIKNIYTSISGLSLKTKLNRVKDSFEEETIIGEEVIDALFDENSKKVFDEYIVIDTIPQEYNIGFKKALEPIGVSGKSIEANFLNIIIKEKVKKSLEHCFQKAQLDIEEFVISPLENANHLLTKEDKELGCALVDIGVETTTIAVYKNGILRKLSVLPLGGNNITKDIMTMDIAFDEAERMKKEDVDLRYQDEEYSQATNISDKIAINEIAYYRTEEIVENIIAQINSVNLNLISGIVLTGGGAKIKNINTIFKSKVAIDKIKTIYSIEPNDSNFANQEGKYNSLLSMVYKANTNCCEPNKEMPRENIKAENIDLFKEDEIIKEQERLAKEKIEQEKKEKEKERTKEKENKEAKKSTKFSFSNLWERVENKAQGFFDEQEE